MVIKLADDVQVAVPTWMLDPLACQQLTDEGRPRVSVAALHELRGLLDSQPFLVTMLVTNQRGSQHAGGDAAQPHRASTATALVPLIAPQTQFEDRRTQLDLRLSRTFQVGGRLRAQANFDVYNVFNASSILGLNNTYGRQWRVPVTSIAIGSGVLNGRLFQFSGRVSF